MIEKIEFIVNGEPVSPVYDSVAIISSSDLSSIVEIPSGIEKDEYEIALSKTPSMDDSGQQIPCFEIETIVTSSDYGQTSVSTTREKLYPYILPVKFGLRDREETRPTRSIVAKIDELRELISSASGYNHERAEEMLNNKTTYELPLTTYFCLKKYAEIHGGTPGDYLTLFVKCDLRTRYTAEKLFDNDILNFGAYANGFLTSRLDGFLLMHGGRKMPSVIELIISNLVTCGDSTLPLRSSALDSMVNRIDENILYYYFMFSNMSKIAYGCLMRSTSEELMDVLLPAQVPSDAMFSEKIFNCIKKDTMDNYYIPYDYGDAARSGYTTTYENLVRSIEEIKYISGE
jgi:hypothetical protein